MGCSGSGGGTRYDLQSLSGKILTGMSEFEAVNSAGPPTEIKTDGDERRLFYRAKEGDEYIEVTLKGNVVIDVTRK